MPLEPTRGGPAACTSSARNSALRVRRARGEQEQERRPSLAEREPQKAIRVALCVESREYHGNTLPPQVRN
jgi:hypothetical protein